ncbi:MAG TPA: ATP synthase F0 subunit C [Bryobacteraceae bacterium]|jgi:F-type H+-transporting ATPase subunit c
MRSKNVLFLLLAVMLLAAMPVFAQGPAGSGVSSGELKAAGLVIGMGLAAGLCGIGQGRAVAGAVEGLARNPGARAGIQLLMIIGLVFIETLAIFTIAVVFTR